MEKIDKVIEILQAFKEGKSIEYHYTENIWNTVNSEREILDCISSDFEDNIRIKKEPTYRPYANAEEFLKASKEHGPYLDGVIPVKYTNNGVVLYSDIDCHSFDFFNWEQIFNLGCKWQDKTPCGVLEQ